jgi:hypothetical protein
VTEPRESLTRTVRLFDGRNDQEEVTGPGLAAFYQALQNERFIVVRTPLTAVKGFTAVVKWPPLSFELVVPGDPPHPVQVFSNVFYDQLAFRLTRPVLDDDERDALTKVERWRLEEWEHYLALHLERLLYELDAIRPAPQEPLQ